MKRISLMCILTCIFVVVCSAQVTIGSEEIPEEGAILDLKQKDEPGGSANSEKGLGLPRVILRTLTIPDEKKSLATTIYEATGDWDPDDHVGLVIYNVAPQISGEVCPVDPIVEEQIPEGPYVWDGKEWQYLGMTRNDGEQVGRVDYVDDVRDGERYPYRGFGDPSDPDNFAGYWMLENARYIDPSIKNFVQEGRNGGTPPASVKDRYYIYPNDRWGNTTGAKPATWRPNQGLLYTYSAATLGGQDDLWGDEEAGSQGLAGSQGQEAGPIETTRIMQGVCPHGWHVPTDREWNMLAKVIFNNPDKYSSYAPSFGLDPNSVQWDSSQEIEEEGGYQGAVDDKIGLGIAMLSPCSPLIENNGQLDREGSIGKSWSSSAGGFNALLVGAIGFGSAPDLQKAYNNTVGFVTSSIHDAGNSTVWGRSIDKESPTGVIRSFGEGTGFSSVRCKRD